MRPTQTTEPDDMLRVKGLVIETDEGEIRLGGEQGTYLEMRDAEGHLRLAMGHQDGGVWEIGLYEPDPSTPHEPGNTRYRAGLKMDAFGTVKIDVNNGALFPHAHKVGLEALALEQYGNRETDAMLVLSDTKHGTAGFFNNAPKALRRVK